MKRFKRIVAIFTLTLLLISALSVCASAEDGYAKWFLSGDMQTLTLDGEKEYHLVYGYYDVYLYHFTRYVYENDDTSIGTIGSASKDAEIVWIEKSYESTYYIYATEKGQEYIEALSESDTQRFRLCNFERGSTDILVEGLIDALDGYAGGEFVPTMEIEVRELASYPLHEVIAVDDTDTLGRTHGAIYEIDGKLCYVGYDGLSNNYFDADGNFSYRDGTVTLSILDESLVSAVVQSFDSYEERNIKYEYEDNVISFENFAASEPSLVAFWIFYSLIAFVAPTPLIVVGIVLANKRRGGAKYWYVLSGAAALWLVLGVTLALMLTLL